MALLRIRRHPDPILRGRSREVKTIGPSIKKLINDMIETMWSAPGIGLAAPQVGRKLRIIVVDLSVGANPVGLFVLINPRIVASGGRQEAAEGCLSLPRLSVNVARAAWIKVKAEQGSDANLVLKADGLLARAIQHEIDHLDGLLILDRASPSEAYHQASLSDEPLSARDNRR